MHTQKGTVYQLCQPAKLLPVRHHEEVAITWILPDKHTHILIHTHIHAHTYTHTHNSYSTTQHSTATEYKIDTSDMHAYDICTIYNIHTHTPLTI